MFKEVIEVCKKNFYVTNQVNNIVTLENSLINISKAFSCYSVKNGNDLPFGRYLIFECPEFNIQLDIFSRDYAGSIHAHGTWGIFGLLQGSLIVNDWMEINKSFVQVRSSLIAPESLQLFVKENDWHSIKTTVKGDQAISLHIYGPNYDLAHGYTLDKNFKIKKYLRSPFKDNNLFKDRIILV